MEENKQNSSFEEPGNLSLSYNKPGCSRDSASPGSKIRMGIRKPPKFTGPKKVLFKGDPGSGKTTISKKVHSDWVQGFFTAVTITGRERLIRSHSSARFCFELSGNSN